MAQPAFQADVLQLEPGSGETLTLSRDPVSGDLRFISPVIPSGILLQSLAGIQTIQGIYLVGKQGSGATYTSVQSAIDAVNGATCTARNPALILISPGVYTENLVIAKDGIHLIGLGAVLLESLTEATPDVSPAHTITINNTLGTPPKQVVLQNLTITNSHQTYACVRISGGAGSVIGKVDTTLSGGKPAVTYGSGGVWIQNCHILAKAAGGYSVWATAINSLFVSNCPSAYSDATATFRVEQCYEVSLSDSSSMQTLLLSYDSTGAIPAKAGSSYVIQNVQAGNLTTTLLGIGSLGVFGSQLGDITLNGDGTVSFFQSQLGSLTANDTVQVRLLGSTKASIAGTGTVGNPFETGTLSYVAASTATYTFAAPQPDADYFVQVELPSAPALQAYPLIENKTSTSFDVVFRDSSGSAIVQTMTLTFCVQR